MTKLNVTIEKQIDKPCAYKFGTFFLHKKYQTVYLLARVGYNQACLIDLYGNRYTDVLTIALLPNGISTDDFSKLTDNQVDGFVPLHNVDVKVW